MKIENVDFTVTDWSKVESTEYPGEKGKAFWKTFEMGNIRVRIVEYSAGYIADHWCSRGHVIYVLEGELSTELKDGSIYLLKPGMSYQVSNDIALHRSKTETGVKMFVVD